METFCYKKMKIFEYDAGHLTKMAPTPIYAKNASIIFFSGTRGLISMKIVMYHSGLWPIIVCSNDDPWLTLTFFTIRPNFVT